MVFSKELAFLVVSLLIQTNAAINLGFFNFKSAPAKNKTNQPTPQIESTKPIAVAVKISDSPATLVHTSSKFDATLWDIIKHEFENETEAVDASPENTTDSQPSAPASPGQEIDETKKSPLYAVNEPVDEDDFEKGPVKIPVAPILQNFSNSTLSEIPSYSTRQTVTFTTTSTITSEVILTKTIYPTCVKLQNIKSRCDGRLETTEPLITQRRDMINHNRQIQNRNRREISLKDLKEAEKSISHHPYLEASELDDQFEEFEDEGNSNQIRATQPISSFASLLTLEPKYHIVTERVYITSTSVRTVTNNHATTTIIAHNCIPRDFDNIKRCPGKSPLKEKDEEKRLEIISQKPSSPSLSFIYEPSPTIDAMQLKKMNSEEKNQKQKIFSLELSPNPASVYEPSSTFDAMDQLHKYFLINGPRLIHSGPGEFETIDLNAGSTIVESSDVELGIMRKRRRSCRVKRVKRLR